MATNLFEFNSNIELNLLDDSILKTIFKSRMAYNQFGNLSSSGVSFEASQVSVNTYLKAIVQTTMLDAQFFKQVFEICKGQMPPFNLKPMQALTISNGITTFNSLFRNSISGLPQLRASVRTMTYLTTGQLVEDFNRVFLTGIYFSTSLILILVALIIGLVVRLNRVLNKIIGSYN